MAEQQDTIAALSTPAGVSGIAVVRLSGPDSLDILSEIYLAPGGEPRRSPWEHRRLYPGKIVNGEGREVDQVVCAVFRAPESYTGEDVVEISCHGSPLVVERILELLYRSGARPAEPGEFTKRAFLNGKIDLIQAEAVCDLIHSRSELQRQVALDQLRGKLSAAIEALAEEALRLLADIEASIDFIDDDLEAFDPTSARELLAHQKSTLTRLLEGSDLAVPFHEGFRVVIAGRPNAGKSSIFNRLVGDERAIVTDLPGTTRDLIRETRILEGLLFIFEDTAGLREGAEEEVENIGIGLARKALERADLVVYVIDSSTPVREGELREIAQLMEPTRCLIALNKVDLPGSKAKIGELSERLAGFTIVETSALTGAGIEELRKALLTSAGKERINRLASERLMLNARLVGLLREASQRADQLEKAIEERRPLEILAVEARELLGCYERATGKRYSEDLLEEIFSRFCVGK